MIGLLKTGTHGTVSATHLSRTDQCLEAPIGAGHFSPRWIQAQWAITGSPSDGARAVFGIRSAVSTAPTTKIPAPHARVAV